MMTVLAETAVLAITPNYRCYNPKTYARSGLPADSGTSSTQLPNRTTATGRAEDRMATCPECDAEIEVDEFDVDKGDQLSCPECGTNLAVTGLSPIELDVAPADEDEDDDDTADHDEDEADEDEDEDEEDGDWDE